MAMCEKTFDLSKGKIYFFRVHNCSIYLQNEMQRVMDRAGGRAGRTGTEKLEWRTDRRDLSVLVKKISDTRYNSRVLRLRPSAECSNGARDLGMNSGCRGHWNDAC